MELVRSLSITTVAILQYCILTLTRPLTTSTGDNWQGCDQSWFSPGLSSIYSPPLLWSSSYNQIWLTGVTCGSVTAQHYTTDHTTPHPPISSTGINQVLTDTLKLCSALLCSPLDKAGLRQSRQDQEGIWKYIKGNIFMLANIYTYKTMVGLYGMSPPSSPKDKLWNKII